MTLNNRISVDTVLLCSNDGQLRDVSMDISDVGLLYQEKSLLVACLCMYIFELEDIGFISSVW